MAASLIYGIDDKEGSAVELAPINSEPADAAKRRIAQVLDSGNRAASARTSNPGGTRRRRIRTDRASSELFRWPAPPQQRAMEQVCPAEPHHDHGHDVRTELRTAFDRTATLAERARQFRDERVNALKNQQTSVRVQPGPLCVVHLVPVASMAGRHSINIAELHDDFVGLEFKEWRGASCKINLDGLLIHPIGIAVNRTGGTAYVQVFRTGVFEAVRVGGGMVDPGRKLIPSTVVSGFFHDALGKLLTRARLFGITGPAVAGIALLFVADYKFGMHEAYFNTTGLPPTRGSIWFCQRYGSIAWNPPGQTRSLAPCSTFSGRHSTCRVAANIPRTAPGHRGDRRDRRAVHRVGDHRRVRVPAIDGRRVLALAIEPSVGPRAVDFGQWCRAGARAEYLSKFARRRAGPAFMGGALNSETAIPFVVSFALVALIVYAIFRAFANTFGGRGKVSASASMICPNCET